MKSIKNENLSKVAIKVSMYNLFSLFVSKFGGLIFTIIIARMLLPELFGVYSLVLSIATIVSTLTDWGMDSAFSRYLSESIGKGDKKLSRSYNRYFLKIKLSLILFSVILLLVISKYLSYSVYKNSLLFYPLLFSCLFIISEALRASFGILFAVRKDFRPIVFFDISFQTLKIVLSVFALLIFTDSLKVSGLFIAFFASGLLTLILMFFMMLKRDKLLLLGKTEKFDKSRIKSYWKYMIFVNLSLVFFGSIDTLMLGKFVPIEYLGYYRAAMSLIVLVSSLFSVSGIFLTIFTQINGIRFKRGFTKILRYILLLSIPATVGIMFIAKYLIKVIYGDSYLPAAFSIYFLSSLILTTPLIGLYQIIFQSKEKPKVVNKSVLLSLVLNIVLNVLAIFLFKNNPVYMVAGVALATSLSRVFLFWLYASSAKRDFKFKIRGIGLRAPIFATIVMSIFLLAFNHFVNMNLFFGAIEVILGVAIYLGVLILLKGITKEDFALIKDTFKIK